MGFLFSETSKRTDLIGVSFGSQKGRKSESLYKFQELFRQQISTEVCQSIAMALERPLNTPVSRVNNSLVTPGSDAFLEYYSMCLDVNDVCTF